eukprot:TRINITY_DN93837_c0_g1_i1.p1 TRINITY_DN93837_c0_g1~~TRINITY_DN93837_c0_g1_i1.p1  ORF type:complete len:510 (+),score=35.19 TRINITY_DN93837_c0_g1_i1:27-1556(+)
MGVTNALGTGGKGVRSLWSLAFAFGGGAWAAKKAGLKNPFAVSKEKPKDRPTQATNRFQSIETLPVNATQLEHYLNLTANQKGPYNALQQALLVCGIKPDTLWKRTIPFIFHAADKYHTFFPDEIPLLEPDGQLTEIALRQKHCVCILANAFLAHFTGRSTVSQGRTFCMEDVNLPSVNFDGIMSIKKPDQSPTAVHKIAMMLRYFEEVRRRVHKSDVDTPALDNKLLFRRSKLEPKGMKWETQTQPLAKLIMHGEKEDLIEAKGELLKVDSANKFIGGNTLTATVEQEEILFADYPELHVARLLFPAMQDGETIQIFGAERFHKHSGYAEEWRPKGAYKDKTPVKEKGDDGKYRQSFFTCMDAANCHYLQNPIKIQRSPNFIARELLKAICGFDVQDAPRQIATGNWGCGSFSGDPELKSIIQLVAASYCKKDLHYFPGEMNVVREELPKLMKKLGKLDVTTAELANFLVQPPSELETGKHLYMQIEEYFSEVPPGDRITKPVSKKAR